MKIILPSNAEFAVTYAHDRSRKLVIELKKIETQLAEFLDLEDEDAEEVILNLVGSALSTSEVLDKCEFSGDPVKE